MMFIAHMYLGVMLLAGTVVLFTSDDQQCKIEGASGIVCYNKTDYCTIINRRPTNCLLDFKNIIYPSSIH